MKERIERHNVIRKMLETSKITSQEELREKLDELGFATTQATLSRDLTALKVIKIPDNEKGYIYALSSEISGTLLELEGSSPLHTCKSITFSGNLAVIKCLPSFAPSVALILDRLNLDIIIGTVAGDDTVLIVIREDVSQQQFKELLVAQLPELHERF
jgi:transcriptional regulator of arginine metabolism